MKYPKASELSVEKLSKLGTKPVVISASELYALVVQNDGLYRDKAFLEKLTLSVPGGVAPDAPKTEPKFHGFKV